MIDDINAYIICCFKEHLDSLTSDELRKFVDSFMIDDEGAFVVDVRNWAGELLRYSTDNHYLLNCILKSINYDMLTPILRKILSDAK
jgi:hypothetical protein